MEAFAAGATQVLVATTVIEVGIDVPNATVILIEGAERYGVSQLHQLRGRVGRGEHASHCLLFPEDAGAMARRRLKAVERERDGFKLAEVDLGLRGRVRSSAPASMACLASRWSSCPRTHQPWSPPATRCSPSCAATAPSTPPSSGRCSRPPTAASALTPPTRFRSNRQVRVIAGELGGQRLAVPRGWKVRPTSDRVREAIFSALGDVAGASVLDLYCGTGALAIEALSRGAVSAVLVDRDTRAALGNVERLGLGERAELVRADVPRWLAGRSGGAEAPSFDLVFVDAPYRLADRVGQELNTHLPGLLADGGRAVVESGAGQPLRLDSLERLRHRRYGAADVAFYGRAA